MIRNLLLAGVIVFGILLVQADLDKRDGIPETTTRKAARS